MAGVCQAKQFCRLALQLFAGTVKMFFLAKDGSPPIEKIGPYAYEWLLCADVRLTATYPKITLAPNFSPAVLVSRATITASVLGVCLICPAWVR